MRVQRNFAAAVLAFTLIAWANGGVRAAQSASSGMPTGAGETIDSIAVRINTDVITESEVKELAAFQTLVDGSAKPRDEVISELTDQWILNGEAATARFSHPSDADVDRAYEALAKQFGTPEEFQSKTAAAGLSEAAVRRQLAAQLYLSRFIDFRFRPAAQVDDAAIQKYYDTEFAPQLKAKSVTVPPLDKVQDTIREVLVQRDINGRANQWLADTRSRLEIDVLPPNGGTGTSPSGAPR